MTQQAPPAAVPAALPSGGIVPDGMAVACVECEVPAVTQLPPVWPSTPSNITGGGGTGGIAEAPLDGIQYGRQSAAWTPVVHTDGGGGVPEAPYDVFAYARRMTMWVKCLPLTGGTIDGALSIDGPLTVVGQFSVNPTNGYSDFFGKLRLAHEPELPTEAATKQYVDSVAGGGIPEAPLEGAAYVRKSGDWWPGIEEVPLDPRGETWVRSFGMWVPQSGLIEEGGGGGGGGAQLKWVNVVGDTMTGPLILHGNATQPLEAVPLQQLTAVTTEIFGAQIDRLNAVIEFLQTRIASLEATMMRGTS